MATVTELKNAASSTASLGKGLCAGWITKVFGKIGVSTDGNACCMYYDYCNKSLSELQEGMIVAVPQTKSSHGNRCNYCGNKGYGHVGIYLNGQVWSSVTNSAGTGGIVIQESLQAFKNRAYSGYTVKCGWAAGVNLSEKVPDAGTNAVYRLYNANNGTHMFTASLQEARNMANAGNKYEGVGFKAGNGAQVYRLYNKNGGHHMWTTSATEVGTLVVSGWTYEGAAFKAGDTVYRLYNANNGEHMFTSSNTERTALVAQGWKDEGKAW